MTSPDNVAVVAARLTKAQRALVAVWPDAWMAASEIQGRRLTGNVASVLADKGIFERRRDPNVWGRSQYLLTATGLAVRSHLQRSKS